MRCLAKASLPARMHGENPVNPLYIGRDPAILQHVAGVVEW